MDKTNNTAGWLRPPDGGASGSSSPNPQLQLALAQYYDAKAQYEDDTRSITWSEGERAIDEFINWGSESSQEITHNTNQHEDGGKMEELVVEAPVVEEPTHLPHEQNLTAPTVQNPDVAPIPSPLPLDKTSDELNGKVTEVDVPPDESATDLPATESKASADTIDPETDGVQDRLQDGAHGGEEDVPEALHRIASSKEDDEESDAADISDLAVFAEIDATTSPGVTSNISVTGSERGTDHADDAVVHTNDLGAASLPDQVESSSIDDAIQAQLLSEIEAALPETESDLPDTTSLEPTLSTQPKIAEPVTGLATRGQASPEVPGDEHTDETSAQAFETHVEERSRISSGSDSTAFVGIETEEEEVVDHDEVEASTLSSHPDRPTNGPSHMYVDDVQGCEAPNITQGWHIILPGIEEAAAGLLAEDASSVQPNVMDDDTPTHSAPESERGLVEENGDGVDDYMLPNPRDILSPAPLSDIGPSETPLLAPASISTHVYFLPSTHAHTQPLHHRPSTFASHVDLQPILAESDTDRVDGDVPNTRPGHFDEHVGSYNEVEELPLGAVSDHAQPYSPTPRPIVALSLPADVSPDPAATTPGVESAEASSPAEIPVMDGESPSHDEDEEQGGNMDATEPASPEAPSPFDFPRAVEKTPSPEEDESHDIIMDATEPASTEAPSPPEVPRVVVKTPSPEEDETHDISMDATEPAVFQSGPTQLYSDALAIAGVDNMDERAAEEEVVGAPISTFTAPGPHPAEVSTPTEFPMVAEEPSLLEEDEPHDINTDETEPAVFQPQSPQPESDTQVIAGENSPSESTAEQVDKVSPIAANVAPDSPEIPSPTELQAVVEERSSSEQDEVLQATSVATEHAASQTGSPLQESDVQSTAKVGDKDEGAAEEVDEASPIAADVAQLESGFPGSATENNNDEHMTEEARSASPAAEDLALPDSDSWVAAEADDRDEFTAEEAADASPTAAHTPITPEAPAKTTSNDEVEELVGDVGMEINWAARVGAFSPAPLPDSDPQAALHEPDTPIVAPIHDKDEGHAEEGAAQDRRPSTPITPKAPAKAPSKDGVKRVVGHAEMEINWAARVGAFSPVTDDDSLPKDHLPPPKIPAEADYVHPLNPLMILAEAAANTPPASARQQNAEPGPRPRLILKLKLRKEVPPVDVSDTSELSDAPEEHEDFASVVNSKKNYTADEEDADGNQRNEDVNHTNGSAATDNSKAKNLTSPTPLSRKPNTPAKSSASALTTAPTAPAVPVTPTVKAKPRSKIPGLKRNRSMVITPKNPSSSRKKDKDFKPDCNDWSESDDEPVAKKPRRGSRTTKATPKKAPASGKAGVKKGGKPATGKSKGKGKAALDGADESEEDSEVEVVEKFARTPTGKFESRKAVSVDREDGPRDGNESQRGIIKKRHTPENSSQEEDETADENEAVESDEMPGVINWASRVGAFSPASSTSSHTDGDDDGDIEMDGDSTIVEEDSDADQEDEDMASDVEDFDENLEDQENRPPRHRSTALAQSKAKKSPKENVALDDETSVSTSMPAPTIRKKSKPNAKDTLTVPKRATRASTEQAATVPHDEELAMAVEPAGSKAKPKTGVTSTVMTRRMSSLAPAEQPGPSTKPATPGTLGNSAAISKRTTRLESAEKVAAEVPPPPASVASSVRSGSLTAKDLTPLPYGRRLTRAEMKIEAEKKTEKLVALEGPADELTPAGARVGGVKGAVVKGIKKGIGKGKGVVEKTAVKGPAMKKSIVANKGSAAKNPAVAKKGPAAKKPSVAKNEPDAKKPALAKKAPAAKKPALAKKAPAAKKGAATLKSKAVKTNTMAETDSADELAASEVEKEDEGETEDDDGDEELEVEDEVGSEPVPEDGEDMEDEDEAESEGAEEAVDEEESEGEIEDEPETETEDEEEAESDFEPEPPIPLVKTKAKSKTAAKTTASKGSKPPAAKSKPTTASKAKPVVLVSKAKPAVTKAQVKLAAAPRPTAKTKANANAKAPAKPKTAKPKTAKPKTAKPKTAKPKTAKPKTAVTKQVAVKTMGLVKGKGKVDGKTANGAGKRKASVAELPSPPRKRLRGREEGKNYKE